MKPFGIDYEWQENGETMRGRTVESGIDHGEAEREFQRKHRHVLVVPSTYKTP